MQQLDDLDAGNEAAAQLQDLLVDHQDVKDFLRQLAVFTAGTLGAETPVHVGITLQRSLNQPLTVASSDDQARLMDEVQYGYDDGPCLHALRASQEVFIPESAMENRWPEFMQHIQRHGVSSMFCIPLELEGRAQAALNIYATEVSAFRDVFRTTARNYAAQASQALRLAVRVAQKATMVEDLQAVLQSRTEIDLAVGVIMGQNRCSQEEAFALLRKASNGRNVKLRFLAGEMVAALNGSAPMVHFESA
jgi:hypothetical protein